MNRIHPYALLALVAPFLATPAWGAANATMTATFFSVDPACDAPRYTFTGTADFTTNDDGGGNDFIAIVYHDTSGNYHDVDFTLLQSLGDGFSLNNDFTVPSPPFTTFVSSRPLIARVHDIPDPGALNENTKEGLEFASDFPVLTELAVDYVADAGACAGKRYNNWALRIESMRNGTGLQIVSSSTALDLDGTGTTQLTFAVPDDSTVVALFRAECSNDAANEFSWANVDIRVDGVALSPTGSDDALCTANGIAGHDQWVMARTSGVRTVTGPATHSVQVFGSAPFGGNARFQDSELIVMIPEPAGWQQRVAGLAALAVLACWRRSRRARRALLGTLALLCAALPATTAQADTVILHTSDGNNQVIAQSAGSTALDLGPGTSYFFGLVRPTRLAIFFTAECSTSAAGTGNWVDIDIRVDGLGVPESDDTDDAFCSSTNGGINNWVSASMHVTLDLPIGHHFVEVFGRVSSAVATDEWEIGDVSLSLIGQEH